MRNSNRDRQHAVRLIAPVLSLLAILSLAIGWSVDIARADGDPASDVLATQQLFLPQDAGIPGAQQTQVAALLEQAARSGEPIRVAIIASATDLGSVTELWRQPENYAQFLGQELTLAYRGPLLVVMPNGFGLYRFTHAATARRTTLAAPSTRGGLGTAAITAIRQLSALGGRPLPLPAAVTATTGTASSSTPWIAFATGVALIAAAWAASLRARPLNLGRRRRNAT